MENFLLILITFILLIALTRVISVAIHEMGNEKDGLDDIKKSMQLDDNNSYAYKNLGIYHMEKGEFERAMELFHKAREIDPKTHGLIGLIEDTEKQMRVDKNGYKA